MIELTTPQKMAEVIEDKLQEALQKFEDCFKTQELGKNYYHLVITGEYSRKVCLAIEVLYKQVGWGVAECNTSSERGEPYGLTELYLWNFNIINYEHIKM